MVKKTPEEIAALKAKYGDKSAEKEAAKAAKKAKYGEQNADKNMKTYEIHIPMYWADEPSNRSIAGKYIDLEDEYHKDWVERLVRIQMVADAMSQYGDLWVDNVYKGPYKVKLIRT